MIKDGQWRKQATKMFMNYLEREKQRSKWGKLLWHIAAYIHLFVPTLMLTKDLLPFSPFITTCFLFDFKIQFILSKEIQKQRLLQQKRWTLTIGWRWENLTHRASLVDRSWKYLQVRDTFKRSLSDKKEKMCCTISEGIRRWSNFGARKSTKLNSSEEISGLSGGVFGGSNRSSDSADTEAFCPIMIKEINCTRLDSGLKSRLKNAKTIQGFWRSEFSDTDRKPRCLTGTLFCTSACIYTCTHPNPLMGTQNTLYILVSYFCHYLLSSTCWSVLK